MKYLSKICTLVVLLATSISEAQVETKDFLRKFEGLVLESDDIISKNKKHGYSNLSWTIAPKIAEYVAIEAKKDKDELTPSKLRSSVKSLVSILEDIKPAQFPKEAILQVEKDKNISYEVKNKISEIFYKRVNSSNNPLYKDINAAKEFLDFIADDLNARNIATSINEGNFNREMETSIRLLKNTSNYWKYGTGSTLRRIRSAQDDKIEISAYAVIRGKGLKIIGEKYNSILPNINMSEIPSAFSYR